jgi:hypothetical protein
VLSWEEAKEILFFVPKPLRRWLAVVVFSLAVLAAFLDLRTNYGTAEALASYWWLGAAALACGILVIRTWVSTSSWNRWRRVRWSTFFLLVGIALAVSALQRSSLEYNEVGFYESRSWALAPSQPAEPDRRTWEWQMTAVLDLTKSPFLVEIHDAPHCEVLDFQPDDSHSPYHPLLTDVSAGLVRSTRWRVENFRKPADLLFRLTIKRDNVVPTCKPRIIASQPSKSSDAS